ncbi:MAG: hypothetical protein WC629_01905 [Candidatus Paceibacterota bacterium]|jgi:hypothetical protein
MIYKITSTNDTYLETIFKESLDDLNTFYEIDWQHHLPNIIVVDDRKTINLLKGEETEPWIIGWSEGKTIYILNKDNFETESNHKYNHAEYSAFVKHEMSHSFFSALSGGRWKPVWLNEGVAIYTSGQNNFKQKPGEFKHFLESYDRGNKEIYSEAGFIVEFLIEKYGKEKLLTLIKNLKNYPTKELFEQGFEKEYGFALSYEGFNHK